MKKKTLLLDTFLFALMTALLTMILNFSSQATEEPSKQIQPTVCCLNGTYIGNSSNCTLGSGDCIDQRCTGVNTTEEIKPHTCQYID